MWCSPHAAQAKSRVIGLVFAEPADCGAATAQVDFFAELYILIVMCASFMLRQRNPGQYGIAAEYRIDIEEYYDRLIVPQRPSPVYKLEGDTIILTAMRFALLPSWAKEPKVKFATHNARLETIDEKPTWKTVFVKRHCLVPMTDFIEPIYEGDFAGNMVSFAQRAGAVILAAGVYDEWVNRESGEVIPSFSIITFTPPPFVAATGHDRCPVFLAVDKGKEWLENQGQPAKQLKNFLLEGRSEPDLIANKHRAMRPGWEKRQN